MRKFYTLREGKYPEETILSENGTPIEFSSYNEAYDRMCKAYTKTSKTGTPSRFRIWETFENNGNRITKPA